MNRQVKLAAVALAALGIVILAYALLSPQSSSGTTDHMGMLDGHMTYSSGNVGLIALSSALIVIALMIVVLWQGYEPLPPSMMPPATSANLQAQGAVDDIKTAAPAEQPSIVSEPRKDDVMAREYLVLRLLTGDERSMFKTIMDSGGEALQKELIVRTRMSDAKVSRLLDRLEEKGVITKERHGATNKIRIKPE